jgi:hypothetical protein
VRAAHFGYFFPNTFYAKLDYGGLALAARGGLYVLDFAVAIVPLWPLVVIIVLGARRHAAWVRALLLAVVLQLGAAVYMGGDHFALFRFAVPALPLLSLALLHPMGVAVAAGGFRRGWGALLAGVTAACLLLSSLTVGLHPKRGEAGGVGQFARYVAECRLARQWELMGRWLGGAAPAGASVATIAIGAIGYYSDLRIVDPLGLVNAEVAHLDQGLGRGAAGHEKYDVALVLDQRPEYILLVNVLTRRPVPEARLAGMDWGAFNNALLESADFQASYRYRSYGVGGGRNINIHERRDAPALTGSAN